MPEPRDFNLRRTLIIGSVLLALMVWSALRGRAPSPHYSWQGETMGTHYRVLLPFSPLDSKERRDVKAATESLLLDISRQMSTYREDSDISRFNASDSTNVFRVSEDFIRVLRIAEAVSVRSGGAFDVTIAPLVDLWGFGAAGPTPEPPTDDAIAACLARIGHEQLRILDGQHIRKTRPDLQINLNAVAKGDAVDQIADLLRSLNVTDFYVEIGGEIVVSGLNPDKKPWRLGVELPVYGSEPGDEPNVATLALRHGGVAGSGDYRQFFVADDHVYSHILDPRSGRPVTNGIGAATVIADTCGMADALATTLMVLAPADGLELVNGIGRAEAIILTRSPEGLAIHKTKGFDALLLQR